MSYNSFDVNLLLSFHWRLGFPNYIFSSGLPTEISCAFVISLMRGTWPFNPIVLDFIILIMFYEEYKS